MISQLGYIGISASDLGRWEQFGAEILGAQLSGKDADGSLYFRIDEYHHRIVVHPGADDDIAYAGWMVATQPALREVRERLLAAGVAVRQATPEEIERRKVIDMISFEDPNGLRCEVCCGLRVSADRPFHSPRGISGFTAGDLGLGHIVLFARDLERSLDFYGRLLGFRVSDYIDFKMAGKPVRMAFLHTNPRHHSAAFVQVDRPKKLAHFMLELTSLDDVCRTMYLCQEHGVPITSTLGRHSNDQVVSFYMQSPAGFEIEYGHGGRLVDDADWVVQYHQTPSMWGHKRQPH